VFRRCFCSATTIGHSIGMPPRGRGRPVRPLGSEPKGLTSDSESQSPSKLHILYALRNPLGTSRTVLGECSLRSAVYSTLSYSTIVGCSSRARPIFVRKSVVLRAVVGTAIIQPHAQKRTERGGEYLGLTQQQLLTESRIAIITQGLAGRYSRGSDHLQAL